MALFAGLAMTALAWALGISLINSAHADKAIVVVDGQQEVLSNRLAVENPSDLYIIELDDVTDELMVYVWRDSNGDGSRDRFDLIDRTADGWAELAGQ